MSHFGGLLEMKTGIDGIALSRDEQWVYYGAMNHDALYRVPTSVLQDHGLNDTEIAMQIQVVEKYRSMTGSPSMATTTYLSQILNIKQ